MKPDFSDYSSLAGVLFRPAVGQVYSDAAGELSILDSKRGVYYGLDPVGARIWSLILDSKTVGQIHSILLEEYDVNGTQLEEDILNLFNELFTRGLVEVAPAGSKPHHSTATKQHVHELR